MYVRLRVPVRLAGSSFRPRHWGCDRQLKLPGGGGPDPPNCSLSATHRWHLRVALQLRRQPSPEIVALNSLAILPSARGEIEDRATGRPGRWLAGSSLGSCGFLPRPTATRTTMGLVDRACHEN